MAWFGILSGSAIAFVAIYAARLGASTFEISLLNASPAVTNLLLALPAGYWVQKRPLGRTVFVTSVLHRMFYLPWIVMPWLLSSSGQVWLLILSSLLMSIPGTALAISFNAMFAGAVPEEWRAYVVGLRQALYALVSITVSLFCGWILESFAFPLGYQLVFLIGLVGGVMSSYYLFKLRAAVDDVEPDTSMDFSRRDWASPGNPAPAGSLRTTVGLRWLRGKRRSMLSLAQLLKGKYGLLMLLMFAFHLTQYLAIPLFPLYFVNEMGLTDQAISIGNSLFYVALFVGSLQLSSMSERWGHHKVLTIGVVTMTLYPALLALATGAGILYYLVSIIGGLSWSLAGGALANYLLARIPEGEDRPSYLAWYNIALYSGVLVGSLLAPVIGQVFGLVMALVVCAIARLVAGVALWKLG
jgi:MFS family permease